MLTDQLAIRKGSRILITGANSYLGSNIIDLLLELGYNVRGSIRGKKPWLDRLFEEKYGQGRFETLVTPSLGNPGAFDHSLVDVAGVVHVASDVSFNPDPNIVVTPVVAVTLNAPQVASKYPSVKRFVLTSSSSARLTPPAYKKLVVTEGTWNDAAVAAAWSEHTPPGPVTVYAASKTEGERAAWKWVEESRPGIVFNAVLPN
ncbi:unnamed protein product [Clonostachys rhizophaga]|uniref:NAD-dependent epimerase/dehydratase domain-containing protein n=1 Tax=Clonostachys rhizophaga TaxID=160324 RepID=A0A9N9VZY5_9HYPO|nr:unnamed protein product [Clonostachys rhizophaga]